MELPKPPQNNLAPQDSASDRETTDSGVSLFLRLWSYGGPSQPPVGLRLEEHAEIKNLIDGIVGEGHGVIAERQPELLAVHFDNAISALTTAKALQQRFLTFHRATEPQQVVPSILIYSKKSEATPSPDEGAPEDMLANVTSAQILIAASVYEQTKNVPGIKFNSKPVREAGESFSPEAIYELLWTDESTYGHLRRASRAGLKTIGRYQVQEELGRGAMGAVYKAYDEVIGRTVALKTIPIDLSTPDRDELIERLKQEAKAAGGLDHPNIITIYDVGQENDVVYLSMQFVKGMTLATLLADVGVPSLATFLSWADQISAAVAFAHERGVIHRDLKPANLMVTEQGVIKILDFGIAKVGNTSLTQTGLVVGTPSYMSPELVSGKAVDHRADIFALGSVFYELLTHEKPFHGDVTTVLYKIIHEEPVAPSRINPSVPGAIDAVIRKALAKDPKQRFQTCEEMRKAFQELASRLHTAPAPVVLPAATTPKVESRPAPPVPSFLLEESAPKPSRVWPKIATIVALALVGVASWAFYTRSKTGAFPPYVQNMVGAIRQASKTLPIVKQSGGQTASTGQSTDASKIHPGDGTSSQPMPANQPSQSAQAAPGTSDGSGATTQIPSEQSSSGASLASDPAQASAAQRSPFSAPAPTPATQTPALVNGSAPSAATVQPVSARQPNTTDAAANGPVGTGGPEVPSNSDAGKDESEPTSPAHAEKPKPAAPKTVDGFGRKDIPQLLHLADMAAKRGDYRLATYEYGLILKIDHGNAAARKGLQGVRADQATH